jgi:hypothetical protein
MVSGERGILECSTWNIVNYDVYFSITTAGIGGGGRDTNLPDRRTIEK